MAFCEAAGLLQRRTALLFIIPAFSKFRKKNDENSRIIFQYMDLVVSSCLSRAASPIFLKVLILCLLPTSKVPESFDSGTLHLLNGHPYDKTDHFGCRHTRNWKHEMHRTNSWAFILRAFLNNVVANKLQILFPFLHCDWFIRMDLNIEFDTPHHVQISDSIIF